MAIRNQRKNAQVGLKYARPIEAAKTSGGSRPL